MIGKHIELFLVDGTPGGLTTAEIIGWTGHVVRGERVHLGDFLKREESNRNGVYVLLGDDDTAPTGTKAYIGRSENIAQRLRNHAANKEFWDRFVTITTRTTPSPKVIGVTWKRDWWRSRERRTARP